jgi:hypothetical protein
MTLESTLTKKTYVGNGSATEWPVPFAYSRTEDLYLVLTDAAGNETPVTDNFQVNVTQAGDAPDFELRDLFFKKQKSRQ